MLSSKNENEKILQAALYQFAARHGKPEYHVSTYPHYIAASRLHTRDVFDFPSLGITKFGKEGSSSIEFCTVKGQYCSKPSALI